MPRKYAKRKYNRRKRPSSGWANTLYKGYRTVSQYTNWSTVWKAINQIKRMVNVERKFFDTAQTAQTPGSAGAIYLLSQIAQGDAYNNRQGNSCKAISNLLRMEFSLNAANEYDYMRCILFIDNENSGSTPAVSDVLEAVVTESPINHINGSRFSILKDETLTLKKDMNATTRKYYTRLDNHIKWSSGVSSALKEGHIFLLVLAQQNANPTTFNYYNRIRFVDN